MIVQNPPFNPFGPLVLLIIVGLLGLGMISLPGALVDAYAKKASISATQTAQADQNAQRHAQEAALGTAHIEQTRVMITQQIENQRATATVAAQQRSANATATLLALNSRAAQDSLARDESYWLFTRLAPWITVFIVLTCLTVLARWLVPQWIELYRLLKSPAPARPANPNRPQRAPHGRKTSP